MFKNLFRRDTGVDDRLDDIINLDNFDTFMDEGDAGQDGDSASAIDDARALLDPINDMLSGGKFGQGIRQQLERANVKLTVAEYLLSQVGASAGIFTITTVFLHWDIVNTIVAGVVGFFLPRFLVNREINKRLNAFETQLPDTLGLWVNALRSGFSVLQAMEAIAKDAPEPTMTEFRRIVKEVQLGIDMEDAFEHLLVRIQSPDLDLVVTAVNIQREVGGNLAEILEVISTTIRERIKLKGEIRVLTSQGRYTGYLISFLPIGLAFFLNATQPGYMGPMFEDRGCGWPMIGVALALIGIGTAIIQKIVDIEI